MSSKPHSRSLPRPNIQAGKDADGDAVERRTILAIYQRRGMWDITARATMVNPLNAESVLKATGEIDAGFINSLIRFFLLLDSKALDIAVPPRPRTACVCREGKPHRHLEDNELIVDFWLKCKQHADPDVRVVGEKAVEACSFQFSSACVERSFAMLTNVQHDTTLHAGDHYLQTLAMFTVNKRHLVNMYRAPMRDLASKLGH